MALNPLCCAGMRALILPPAVHICVHSGVMGTHGGMMCAQDREGKVP